MKPELTTVTRPQPSVTTLVDVEELSHGEFDAPPGPQRAAVAMVVPRSFMVLVVLIVTTPWLIWGGVLLAKYGTRPVAAPDSELIMRGNPGPWGELEYTRITIAPPLEFIAELQPSKNNAWHFVGMTRAELAVFFTSVLDLAPADRQWLIENAKPDATSNALVVVPPDDLVRRLTPKSRMQIYNLLHEWEINQNQNAAFRFGGTSVEEWAAGAQLSQGTMDQLRRLAYPNGSYMFFGDLYLVLPTITDPIERSTLIQTVARESTMLVKLEVDDDTDVDKLAAYWGRGGRAKDVRPLIESLARVPGRNRIDIAHLLPPFARRRLYTYPSPTTDPMGATHDCHWTALNFFSEIPAEISTDGVVQTIKDDYYPIYGNLAFGDLVLYLTKTGQLYHSAVYIADDVLYTKNGSRTSRPWMFTRMEDMHFFYPQRDGFEIRYYRRKGS